MKNHLFALRGSVLFLSLFVSLSALAVDRINITDYGATPDSTNGSYDTAAINAAVAAAGASGGSIYFPPGRYDYEGAIQLDPNKSFRLYGDGPGVSTIAFACTGSNPQAGIFAIFNDNKNLTVEGLTLQAKTNCGGAAAIWVAFGATTPKYRTATIQNVQIVGSARDGTSGANWGGGIFLHRANNTVIDSVEISGNKSGAVTDYGLWWNSPFDVATTGLNASNLQIKWCNSAFRTVGHVEGIYMTGFDFFDCGRGTASDGAHYAVELTANVGVSPSFLKPTTAHFVNGKIDSVQGGLRTSILNTKVSNVRFTHTGSEALDGTMLWVDGHSYSGGTTDAMVTECSFYGVQSSVAENGVFVQDAHSVRIAGNNFTHMQPGSGSCIVAIGTSSVVRITDNLFDNVRQAYNVPSGTYCEGNDPTNCP
jgi:hypothetical protein